MSDAAVQKLGFWGRLKLYLEAMEKTETDYVWDNIRSLREENKTLKARLDTLEARLEADASH